MKGDDFSGLVIYGKKGAAFSKTEAELLSENIKRILTTRRGERVGEPDFGSNIMTYLFMPQMLVEDLIAEIITSIERSEPRVIVNNCTLRSSKDEIINIDLDLTIRTRNLERLQIGVTL